MMSPLNAQSLSRLLNSASSLRKTCANCSSARRSSGKLAEFRFDSGEHSVVLLAAGLALHACQRGQAANLGAVEIICIDQNRFVGVVARRKQHVETAIAGMEQH